MAKKVNYFVLRTHNDKYMLFLVLDEEKRLYQGIETTSDLQTMRRVVQRLNIHNIKYYIK